MENELKRYVKYNSKKFCFLKLRNKFFDRLRNRGFRIYYLTKIFASVSYSSRNKYLFTSDKIYSNVVQETQAEAAIMEVGEAIFNDHFNSLARKWKTSGKFSKTGKLLQQIRLYLLGNYLVKKTKNQTLICSVLPGKCSFQQCFNNSQIGALFSNEQKLGDLISKSKL